MQSCNKGGKMNTHSVNGRWGGKVHELRGNILDKCLKGNVNHVRVGRGGHSIDISKRQVKGGGFKGTLYEKEGEGKGVSPF